jgi:hypothetical protein
MLNLLLLILPHIAVELAPATSLPYYCLRKEHLLLHPNAISGSMLTVGPACRPINRFLTFQDEPA